jgi:hypothetical protein
MLSARLRLRYARKRIDERNSPDQLINAVIRHELANLPEWKKYQHNSSIHSDGLVDYLFAVEDDAHEPDGVFDRLRWGGQFIYITRDRKKLRGMSEYFDQRGYRTIKQEAFCRPARLGVKLPLVCPRIWYFIARKVQLIRPRELTERFTYHVELVDDMQQGGCVVLKQVPSFERVVARLRARFTDVPLHVIHTRAKKFTDKIFPLFLTREAAILQILQRHLPPSYRNRVPRVLHMETDGRGYVRKLYLNWLRNGGRMRSQLEFAEQAAELLSVIHDTTDVIHLDLRLDNMVITERGVGFVDFGSSVRVGEDIGGNPLLNTIFGELMRTSEIQRMLTKMKQSGHVTSDAILKRGHHQIDKAVDFFYLAVQINLPLANPDFRGLVHYDAQSNEAKEIQSLTERILRPTDPAQPEFKSARDILRALEAIGDDDDDDEVMTMLDSDLADGSSFAAPLR